jgi:predicted Fe-Mo cluster-binding NifX family protein
VRIAVPTNDGITLCEHFGRGNAFLVFEIADGRIASRETRVNQPHAAHSEECNHAGGGGGHDHAAIAATLAGCEVVLCGGIGGRAVEALRACGISPVMVAASGNAEDLAKAYAAGSLPLSESPFCRCSH